MSLERTFMRRRDELRRAGVHRPGPHWRGYQERLPAPRRARRVALESEYGQAPRPVWRAALVAARTAPGTRRHRRAARVVAKWEEAQ